MVWSKYPRRASPNMQRKEIGRRSLEASKENRMPRASKRGLDLQELEAADPAAQRTIRRRCSRTMVWEAALMQKMSSLRMWTRMIPVRAAKMRARPRIREQLTKSTPSRKRADPRVTPERDRPIREAMRKRAAPTLRRVAREVTSQAWAIPTTVIPASRQRKSRGIQRVSIQSRPSGAPRTRSRRLSFQTCMMEICNIKTTTTKSKQTKQ